MLLVEDDPIETELIERVLARCPEPIELRTLSEPDAARAVLAVEGVDLLLIDYTLPGITGGEFTAELREAGVDVPILVLSIASRPEYARECHLAGANAFVVKPISPEEHARFGLAMDFFLGQARLILGP